MFQLKSLILSVLLSFFIWLPAAGQDDNPVKNISPAAVWESKGHMHRLGSKVNWAHRDEFYDLDVAGLPQRVVMIVAYQIGQETIVRSIEYFIGDKDGENSFGRKTETGKKLLRRFKQAAKKSPRQTSAVYGSPPGEPLFY